METVMQLLMSLFALATLLAAGLATISIWSPRKLWVKVGAVLLAACFMPISYASFTDLLSKPKPVALEWFNRSMTEATVLSARMQEGEAIYLWLQLPNSPEPRYYKIGWSEEVAKQLQQAMREAEKNQGGMRMEMPFENTWDTDKPMFYALPQPKLPEKNGEEGGGDKPMVYQHPGTSA
jgi:hypothetical protein